MHTIADKMYATLTPTQRASAFVSALARKDFTESRRLKETAYNTLTERTILCFFMRWIAV